MLIEPAEAGRRVRAARAYANLSRECLAERCGLTLKQVRDLEEGRRTVTTLDELDTIAVQCDVPIEFVRDGFTGTTETYERIWQLMTMVPGVDREALLALTPRIGAVAKASSSHRSAGGRALPPRDGVAVRPGGRAAQPGSGAPGRKTRN